MSTRCVTNVTGNLRARSHHKYSREEIGPMYLDCHQNTQQATKRQRTATHTLWSLPCRNLAWQPRIGGELANHHAKQQDLHMFC
jgi:hypothetical protein